MGADEHEPTLHAHLADRNKILVILGMAGTVMSGQHLEPGEHYVKDWEVDAPDGAGLVLTQEITEAKVYRGVREAFLAWRAVPARHPTRFDGRPNRPLTTFTIEIRDAP